MRFREARPDDAKAVAGLHADSWQRHYRGAYADDFLDGEPSGFLDDLWTSRLTAPSPLAHTILAELDGELVGLIHTLLEQDRTWGAFIDNLHVRHTVRRQGIGARLLAMTALAVHARTPSSGLHLLVLEQNADAQAFYVARGGTRVEYTDVPPPGGDPARLHGRPKCFRIAWHAPMSREPGLVSTPDLR